MEKELTEQIKNLSSRIEKLEETINGLKDLMKKTKDLIMSKFAESCEHPTHLLEYNMSDWPFCRLCQTYVPEKDD